MIKEIINKKLLIVIGLLLLVVIILKTIDINREQKYLNMKTDSDENYIYTKYSSDINNSEVPIININTEEVTSINNEIVLLSEKYLTNSDATKSITYRYNRSNNLLSLVLIFKDLIDDKVSYSFKTYILNLNKDVMLVSDDEVKEIFNLKDTDIKFAISDSLKEKYDDELNKGYLKSSECNFNCFLKLRNINDILDNVEYYVEDGALVVYKTYNVYSLYNEERYFTRNDFKFIIK